ncbi:DDE-domain-containing protein, partial [Dichomitus squalens LYAD-421 SS1]
NRKWVYRFLQRHPGLKLGRPSGLDPKRAQAFNRPVVKDHFRQLENLIKSFNIPWSHVYNMDEKGIQRGGGRRLQNIKYFVPRGRRTSYKLRSASLELVTIIECVCADGSNIMPGFIFSGKEFMRDWFQNVDCNVTIAHSPNGWTDDFLCLEWFRKCFIPQATARRETDAPILLILDGHGSHVTSEMRHLAMDHNIHLFCLPPHTTHRLQPLDVGVFGPLQQAWTKRCNEYYVTSRGREMDRGELIREYL